MDSCSSRFVPLGCDKQGRIYYALSASGPQKGKKDRIPSDNERATMRRWGWFLAVYGKSGTVVKPLGSDDTDVDSDEEEDVEGDRWWGFADADEMRKLSKWIAYEAETKGGASTDSTPQTSNATSDRAVSPARSLTPLSDLEEELDSKAENEARVPRPSKLKELAKSIMEFAEFIDWRLKRDANGAKN